MKKAFIILLSLQYSLGFAQGTAQFRIDSLKHILSDTPPDTNKVNILGWLSLYYAWSNPDTGIIYAQQSLELAEELKYEKGIATAQVYMGSCLTTLGNYPLALDFLFKSIPTYTKINYPLGLYRSYQQIASAYRDFGDSKKSLIYVRKFLRPDNPNLNNPRGKAGVLGIAAAVYNNNNLIDSAIMLGEQSYQLRKDWSGVCYVLGSAYTKQGKFDPALFYFDKGLQLALENRTEIDLVDINNGMSRLYKAKGMLDSAIVYAQKALTVPSGQFYPKGVLNAVAALAELYELQGKPDSTLRYLKASIALKDSLFNREKTMAIQNLAFKAKEKQKELEASEIKSRNRLKYYGLIGSLLVLLLITGILWRSNRYKQEANNLLLRQKNEIKLQKEKAETTLVQLKQAQSQLIQSEKLASLGELTAGIAHEIQNPLNFVTNFSELSVDLAEELKLEMEKLEIPEQDREYVGEILTDLSSNQQKINHHGKRAAAIVTGMLQHARTSTGKKEPSDLNALADEYLRLAYHGLRAKNPDFDAAMVTDFDPSIGKVDVIPQDMGRVLLNLINNAFYAVQQRKKEIEKLEIGKLEIPYEPTVTVSTQKVNNQIIMRVKDNGTGIPEAVKAKIFQPFFTTKPTGQGTGLGLSLAYDIVVKGHGGALEVEGKEGEGTEFIVKLPYANLS